MVEHGGDRLNPLLKGPVFGVWQVGGVRCRLALCMSAAVLVLCVLPVCLPIPRERAWLFSLFVIDEEAVTAGQIGDDGAIHCAVKLSSKQ